MEENLKKIITIIKLNLKHNLYSIILGGSRGKNLAIENWSDYDIYIIVNKFEIEDIININNELKKDIKEHVGITVYTVEEVEKCIVDDKTKVMFYERESMKVNPTIYGQEINIKFELEDIKRDDEIILPKIIHELRRGILEKNYSKLIKRVTVLIKILLRKNNIFSYGYKNVFDDFYKLSANKNIKLNEKINIEVCIEQNNNLIYEFTKEIINNYLKY